MNLDALGKRGYHIPRTGTVQVVSKHFNPVCQMHSSTLVL